MCIRDRYNGAHFALELDPSGFSSLTRLPVREDVVFFRVAGLMRETRRVLHATSLPPRKRNAPIQRGAFRVGARPFGFLVINPIAGSRRCRFFPGSGFDEGNPKGLARDEFAAPTWQILRPMVHGRARLAQVGQDAMLGLTMEGVASTRLFCDRQSQGADGVSVSGRSVRNGKMRNVLSLEPVAHHSCPCLLYTS